MVKTIQSAFSQGLESRIFSRCFPFFKYLLL